MSKLVIWSNTGNENLEVHWALLD